jgi:formate-dependent nitrite reductase membrane component NrfD
MNLFVSDPEWGWWIILYFFLGGLAAGAYFLATLIDIVGRPEDRPLSRLGYLLAFPLVSVCGILLTIDLDRPERFWHMLFQSERVHEALDEGWPGGGWATMAQAVMLKPWSPMSVGAWALAVFGFFSFLSFVASLWPQGRLSRVLNRPVFGRVFHLAGCAVGFFIAAYTGVLLHATNQPVWSASEWIGPLFLTSAASTGIAAVLLIARWRGGVSPDSVERLESADLWALGLELAVYMVFLASLGPALVLVFQVWQGWLLAVATPVLALLVPLLLHMYPQVTRRRGPEVAAAFALLGGFLLRYAIVMTPPAVLAYHQADQPRSIVRNTLPGHVPDLVARYPSETSELTQTTLWETVTGKALVACTLLLALLAPVAFRLRLHFSPRLAALTALFSLVVMGGVFFYAFSPPGVEGPELVTISPEVGRPRGGGVGASGSNRPRQVLFPHSKIKGVARQ